VERTTIAGETEELGKNLLQRHFFPPHIPHDQVRFRTPDRSGGKPATNRLSYGAALTSLLVRQERGRKAMTISILPAHSNCRWDFDFVDLFHDSTLHRDRYATRREEDTNFVDESACLTAENFQNKVVTIHRSQEVLKVLHVHIFRN
jgi:hypothetical protein